VLLLPTLLVGMDIGVLYLALPYLSAELDATGTQQLWIMDVYGFTLAGFLVTMGTLGDRIGRRKLLLIGAGAFAVGSVVAAYSASAEMLIVTRALLGIAGATLMPSTLALIRNLFPDPRRMSLAIAGWLSCLMGGSALGPAVGGLMIQNFWWGSVFLLGVPLMVLLLIAGPVLLPEYRDENAGRLDLTSVVLSLAAILPVMYGMKELAAGDAPPVVLAVTIVGGAVCGWLFVRRQLRLEDPLLDLRLFANRMTGRILSTLLLAAAALAGSSLLVAQYMQMVLVLGPMEAGLWLIPSGIGLAIGSQLGPRLAGWMRPATAIVWGMGVAVIGFALATMVDAGSGPVPVVVATFLIHIGAGPLFALGVAQVVSSAPPEKGGSISALSETSNNLGSTLGLAIMGTIAAAIYRARMDGTVPAGVPEDTAADVSGSLAGATTSADRLPAGTVAEVLEEARNASVAGLTASMAVGGAVFATLAVLIWRTLRQLPRTSAADSPAPGPDAPAESESAQEKR
jgi:DHA2 family multidrug resistance protein-like MFS transporter